MPNSYIFSMYKKSRLVSSVDRGPPSWTQLLQSDKDHTPVINTKEIDTLAINWNSGSSESTSSSQLTLLVQNAASELASSGQPGEVNAFLRYVKNHFPELGNFQLPDTSHDEKRKTSYSFETLEQVLYFSIRDEMHVYDLFSSNLVNEDEKVPGNANVTIDTGSALLGKYTADLVREMLEISSPSEDACSENASIESTSQHLANDGFGPTDCDGVHLSSCGHAVHQGCLDRYLSSLKERYASFRFVCTTHYVLCL